MPEGGHAFSQRLVSGPDAARGRLTQSMGKRASNAKSRPATGPATRCSMRKREPPPPLVPELDDLRPATLVGPRQASFPPRLALGAFFASSALPSSNDSYLSNCTVYSVQCTAPLDMWCSLYVVCTMLSTRYNSELVYDACLPNDTRIRRVLFPMSAPWLRCIVKPPNNGRSAELAQSCQISTRGGVAFHGENYFHQRGARPPRCHACTPSPQLPLLPLLGHGPQWHEMSMAR
jgi:hypothetical protein